MALVDHVLRRCPTDEAVANLRESTTPSQTLTAAWYTPGADFCFYAPAREACKSAFESLEKLNLQDDELDLLRDPPRAEDLVSRLEEIASHLEKRGRRSTFAQRSSKFFNSFCHFANKTSNIVMILLPQSPEYTVTFGMLFLLFKAVVTKKEREDSLLAHLESVHYQLPLAEFYSSVFPTNQMKECVVKVYVSIMKLLQEALGYYRSGRLGKLVDAIFQAEAKFDDHIKNIERDVQKMNALKEAGHIAQSADMHKIISNTGQVVVKIYENFECQANAIGTSMEIMTAKMDRLTVQTNMLLKFEMARYSRELQDILAMEGHNLNEEQSLLTRSFQLSPKDHWENNGVLENLREWADEGRDRLLWVGGCSGNQDSWVSELSVDMIQALQSQRLTLLYVFCEQKSNAALTPIALLRSLLVQLLELHPEIPYANPDIWSPQKVKAARSFERLWSLLQRTVNRLSNVFVIIDRIEECEATEEADIVNTMLPNMIDWASRCENVSVMVTSNFVPPEEVDDLPMFATYIDTSKKATKR